MHVATRDLQRRNIEHARTDAPAPETIQRVVRGWSARFSIYLSIYRHVHTRNISIYSDGYSCVLPETIS